MITQSDIKKLFNKARRIIKHPGLDCLRAPKQGMESKLVVITPGRIGTAVERNTIRRRIKALFHEQELDQKEFDYIIIIKKPGVLLSYDDLKKIFIPTLTQNN